MLKYHHIFNKENQLVKTLPATAAFVGTFKGKQVNLREGNTVIENSTPEYPWPITLEEDVIVRDTDQVPFEKKWRSSKEVKELKAKRAASAKA